MIKNFTLFFEQLLQQCNEKNDVDSITALLQKSGSSHELISEWNVFFERITHAAYAQSDNKNADELCGMAKQWLERLEKSI